MNDPRLVRSSEDIDLENHQAQYRAIIETVHQPQRQLTIRYACLQMNNGIPEYAFGKNFSYIYSMYANQ